MHNEISASELLMQKRTLLTETERNKTEIIHSRFDTDILGGDAVGERLVFASTTPTDYWR